MVYNMNPYSHIRGIDFSLKFLTSKTNAKDTFLELFPKEERTGKNIIKGDRVTGEGGQGVSPGKILQIGKILPFLRLSSSG